MEFFSTLGHLMIILISEAIGFYIGSLLLEHIRGRLGYKLNYLGCIGHKGFEKVLVLLDLKISRIIFDFTLEAKNIWLKIYWKFKPISFNFVCKPHVIKVAYYCEPHTFNPKLRKFILLPGPVGFRDKFFKIPLHSKETVKIVKVSYHIKPFMFPFTSIDLAREHSIELEDDTGVKHIC